MAGHAYMCMNVCACIVLATVVDGEGGALQTNTKYLFQEDKLKMRECVGGKKYQVCTRVVFLVLSVMPVFPPPPPPG